MLRNYLKKARNWYAMQFNSVCITLLLLNKLQPGVILSEVILWSCELLLQINSTSSCKAKLCMLMLLMALILRSVSNSGLLKLLSYFYAHL